jgi:hypothetical protein
MGREVQCKCKWANETGTVKAMLESDEIIVRGDIKHRVPTAEISRLRVDAEGLHFAVGGDRVTIAMGESEAERWLKKMMTPPPGLREKLGLRDVAKALVIGPVSDAALKEALHGYTTSVSSDARMVIAVTQNDRHLADAVHAYKLLNAGAALWIVYTKGKNSTFGETRVRDGLRALGFVDTKVASVSTALTASRFSLKK